MECSENEKQLEIKVFDKGRKVENSLVGQGVIDLRNVLARPCTVTKGIKYNIQSLWSCLTTICLQEPC